MSKRHQSDGKMVKGTLDMMILRTLEAMADEGTQ